MTMSVVPKSHEMIFNELLERLDGKTFNMLVEVGNAGGVIKVLKYCNRSLGGVEILKPFRASIRLSPGSCIVWDLRAEGVSINFGEEDIKICRFFDNRQYRKVLTLTSDPI